MGWGTNDRMRPPLGPLVYLRENKYLFIIYYYKKGVSILRTNARPPTTKKVAIRAGAKSGDAIL